MSTVTQASFLKDVSEHEMKVLLDSGVHRCLRFQKHGSSIAWFDIVTWPGFLAYTGDMGSFVFQRLNDMFTFFRTDRREDGVLGINRSYWSEKLEAVDSRTHRPGHSEFSADKLRQRIEETIKSWVEECDVPYDASAEEESVAKNVFEGELRRAIEDDVYRYLDLGEHEAQEAVRDFSCEIRGTHYAFSDTWEWNCTEYTYRFTWCCFAIAWAIKQYDIEAERKAATVEAHQSTLPQGAADAPTL